MEIYRRWMEQSVMQALEIWRIVSIAGARQCGKTTLSGLLPQSGITCRSLDEAMYLRAAKEDPATFLHHEPGQTLFIDEIQKAPVLLPAIKRIVDSSNAPGQFLLTGSANLHAIPEATESLAGRLHSARLRTLSEGEIRGNAPSFPAMAFAGDFPARLESGGKSEIASLAFRGGYPEPVRIAAAKRATWHRDYLDRLLRHDISEVTEIRRLDKLRAMFTFLAARSSKFINISEIAAALEISKISAENYIAALEAMFLFDRVEAWSPRDYDRAIKRPKWFIGDTGLMCATLKWRQDDVLFDSDRCGKLVESWVYHELAAATEALDGFSIFHYRDRDKREIDFILESGDGDLVGIEVKAGSLVGVDDFRHMDWFADKIGDRRMKRSIVLYSGTDTLSFGKNRLAVPLAALYS